MKNIKEVGNDKNIWIKFNKNDEVEFIFHGMRTLLPTDEYKDLTSTDWNQYWTHDEVYDKEQLKQFKELGWRLMSDFTFEATLKFDRYLPRGKYNFLYKDKMILTMKDCSLEALLKNIQSQKIKVVDGKYTGKWKLARVGRFVRLTF